MLEWLASVTVVRRTDRRIELAVTRATSWAGWTLCASAGLAFALLWSSSRPLAATAALVALLGVLLATARRRLVFDRDDGLLRIEHRFVGLRSRMAVPLFHLRAIVIVQEKRHFVAYVERRTGGRIRIDDGRHVHQLLALAQAICSVTQLRLVSDMANHSSTAG